MQWPLEHAQVIGEYDAPAKQWLPGHRGLDLRARRKTPSSRPRMVWSPSVAKWRANRGNASPRCGNGKPDVDVEPAVTTRPVGAVIAKGERFARVEGGSEHCADECLHWGLKRGTADYLDPQQYAGSRKIVLKPS